MSPSTQATAAQTAASRSSKSCTCMPRITTTTTTTTNHHDDKNNTTTTTATTTMYYYYLCSIELWGFDYDFTNYNFKTH